MNIHIQQTDMGTGRQNGLRLSVTGQGENGAAGASRAKKSGSVIFAGDVNVGTSAIDEKRALAKKQAMKLVSDAYAGDQKTDQSIREIQERSAALNRENGAYRDEIIGNRDKIKELAAQGTTEYQSRALEIYNRNDSLQRDVDRNEQEVIANNAAITQIGIERLKSSPMLDAKQAAQDIIDAANQEILGMMVQDGLDYMEEKRTEEEEKYEKLGEKKKEEQEKLDEARERREEAEAQAENIREKGEETEAQAKEAAKGAKELTEAVVSGKQTAEGLDGELREMLDKLKLLSEDIKGAAVDETR